MNYRRTCQAAAFLLVLTAGAMRPAQALELSAEGQIGYFRMAATSSAEATFGSADTLIYGGALRLTVWRGAFVSIGARTLARDGERVFVASPGSPVQKLGETLTMRTTIIVPALGYRFRDGNSIVPYVSVGLPVTAYRERSDVKGEKFDVDTSKLGFAGAAGIEIGRGVLRLGAEVGYTTAPNAIGSTGVTKVYGENDAGGFHAVGKVIVAFGI
jgi:hypothetical protein